MEMLNFVVKNNDCDFERIARLQTKMNLEEATLCSERAKIITASFKQSEGQSMVIRKAQALKDILSEMSIYHEKDSLILGNQASRNFAAPVFPEYSIKWLVDELDELANRRGDYFNVSEEVKQDIRELAPYWLGKTHQDVVLSNLSELNKKAEKQNVLHRGGISMSGDGHIIPNHEFLFEHGFKGVKDLARDYLCIDGLTQENKDYYNSVILVMEGVLIYLQRYIDLLKEELANNSHTLSVAETEKLIKVFEEIKNGKTTSFYGAVQTVYLIHLIMMIESNGHSFSYGRFDQYIYPFYLKEKEEGSLTDEKALEIITHFFIMNNSLNKIRPWGHTQYSGGYPLYSNLLLAGLKKDGTDGTNELSYLCLEAMNLNRLPEPNLSSRFNEKTPHEYMKTCAKLIRQGFGMPSIFCDEVVMEALSTLDIEKEDILDYSSIGCVEVGVPGKWNHRATGMTYINFGKILEIVLNNGKEPQSKIQLFSLNGNNDENIEFESYEELWAGWNRALEFYSDLAYECDLVCDRSLKEFDADAFASCLIDCSLERGLTLKNGGAKYDYISSSNIGPSVVGDSLAAIKKLIFEENKFTFKELREILKNNFEGEEGAKYRKWCKQAPKFGNDDDYVDLIVADVYESYLKLLPKYKTDRYGKGPIGCGYTMSTSNITSYVPNGFDVGATPDGRLATKPLNEGASPCLGADRNGPTAVINSVSKLPNEKMAGGQLLNMRFAPGALAGDENLEKFTHFIEAGRLKNIFHNQFNIVDSKTLRLAKANPNEYPELMVRVAGYCALFSTLMPEAQDAIIERTELDWN